MMNVFNGIQCQQNIRAETAAKMAITIGIFEQAIVEDAFSIIVISIQSV